MVKDSIEEIESTIWDYKHYKGLSESLGGNTTSHSQYLHLQDVIRMCDIKILELKNKIKSLQEKPSNCYN